MYSDWIYKDGQDIESKIMTHVKITDLSPSEV